MNCKKKLKELTLKDNFMFGAVMAMGDNCRRFLELVVDFRIGHILISTEKSIIYHPEYRGVRLDVYASDDQNSRYNVEMQVIRKPGLGKRARYYHSQMDMELLLSGDDYPGLPDTYVIFICDFDPFDAGLYCYTFENRCLENGELKLNEGCRTIFLNTCGVIRNGVSIRLIRFLEFIKADLAESQQEFTDVFVKQLQSSVQEVKSNREMEERFMILQEMLRDEYAEGIIKGKSEGKAEGISEVILELLAEKGTLPDELRDKILSEKNLQRLKRWIHLALHSESIRQFMDSIQ